MGVFETMIESYRKKITALAGEITDKEIEINFKAKGVDDIKSALIADNEKFRLACLSIAGQHVKGIVQSVHYAAVVARVGQYCGVEFEVAGGTAVPKTDKRDIDAFNAKKATVAHPLPVTYCFVRINDKDYGYTVNGFDRDLVYLDVVAL